MERSAFIIWLERVGPVQVPDGADALYLRSYGPRPLSRMRPVRRLRDEAGVRVAPDGTLILPDDLTRERGAS